jgi:hypothetical protein
MRRRRVRLLVFAALLTATLLGGTASSVQSATPPKPVVAVTPNTGLADLQLVTVAGTGFSARASLAVLECRPGATQPADCDLGTLSYFTADASGAFSTQRAVHRLVGIGGTNIDCAKPSSCVLAAANVGNYAESNGVTLGFDPNKPFVVPKVTVSPSRGLADHQLVTIKGTGFAPLSTVSVTQCQAPTTATPSPSPAPPVIFPPFPYGACDTTVYRYLRLGNGQEFTTGNFPVQRVITVYGPAGPKAIDCAVAPGCILTARGSGTGSSATFDAAISFDPKKPTAVQDISVTPASNLVDHQVVTVRGSGFVPGAPVSVLECGAAVCDYSRTRQVTPGLTGAFTLSFAVQRSVSFGYGAGPSGPPPIDCVAQAGSCVLRVNSSRSGVSGPSRALTFDASRAAAKESLDVKPDDNLRDNQIVRVRGKGFIPLQSVQLVECSSAIEHSPSGQFELCDSSTFAQASVDRHGVLDVDFAVHDVMGSPAALVSCAPRNCVLVAQTGGFFGYTPGFAIPSVPGLSSSVTTVVGSGASASVGAVSPGPDEHVSFPYVTLQFATRDR